jgi:predicted PurR-regulated permease PerM
LWRLAWTRKGANRAFGLPYKPCFSRLSCPIRQADTDIVRNGGSASGEERRIGPFGRANLFGIVVAIAVLYFVREVFIPLALAILFAFLLAPLVIRLRHWGLGRMAASLIVVCFSFALVTTIASVLVSQASDLAHKLPGYQQNVREKLHSVRASGGGILNRVSRTIHNITDELIPAPPAQQPGGQPGQDKPVPVEIRKGLPGPLEVMQTVAGSLFPILLNAAIVVVLVIFILMQREDLRDRVIRLLGSGRINVTTQALDDAAGRLGRYLLAQLIINLGYGCLAGTALYFMGIPDPILWGMLAALFRYIPYLGIWIAAALPALIVFAVDPGWIKVPLVFGIYFGIDLLMYNFAEPLLYGSTTGISPVAILVAAIFWTWLWGPIGLLLAVPLTVCLVVLGRYFPSLQFLGILLSDDEVLRPETRFYQRMLAMDVDEARDVAQTFLKEKGKTMEDLDDQVLIPALIMAEEDRHRGLLDEEHQRFMFENTRLLLEDITEALVTATDAETRDPKKTEEAMNQEPPPIQAAEVVCIPARDEADEIAAAMIGLLLNQRGTPARVLSSDSLAGECIEQLRGSKARIACVVAVPPFGYMHARYLCRRLRSEFPDLKIVGAILTERDAKDLKQRRPGLSADELGVTIKEALNAVLSFAATGEEKLVTT